VLRELFTVGRLLEVGASHIWERRERGELLRLNRIILLRGVTHFAVPAVGRLNVAHLEPIE